MIVSRRGKVKYYVGDQEGNLPLVTIRVRGIIPEWSEVEAAISLVDGVERIKRNSTQFFTTIMIQMSGARLYHLPAGMEQASRDICQAAKIAIAEGPTHVTR